MGPQNLLGYVNILSSRQLYPQHGRCHSLSKIREKRKGSKPDTQIAESVPTAPDRNSGWTVTTLGLQALVRFYSMKRTENIFSHPFSTYLGVPQKNNKVRQKQYPGCTAIQLNRTALSSSSAQSTERVWQRPGSQTSEKTQLSVNLGSAISYPQAVSLGRTSYWSYLVNVHFLTCHLIFEIN